jgi:carbon-monoxide dehydrogenase medium subunit
MLLREVEYARPSTVDEAIQLLAQQPGARALAGGQTLLNVMKARAAAPDALVDLNGLAELRGIALRDGVLEIGAMTTYAQVMASSEVATARPVLAEVVSTIADVQVRNRGTVGGNICASDPTNHLPGLMVALGAEMMIRSVHGERRVPAEAFFLGVYFTAVGEGELLTSIRIPAVENARDGFAAMTLGRDGTCIVNAAVSLEGEPRVVLGCVGATPVRARAMEERLRGGDLSESAVRAAAAGIGAELDPPSDVHASAEYRRHLAEVCAVRATLQAAGRRS